MDIRLIDGLAHCRSSKLLVVDCRFGNIKTRRFSSTASSSYPLRYVPKKNRLPNQPPLERSHDLADHTQFTCPNPSKKSNKLHQICQEDVRSHNSQASSEMYRGSDKVRGKCSSYLPREDISKSSKKMPQQSRSHHASLMQHEVNELAEVLFFPNDEKIYMIEEEHIEANLSPRQSDAAVKAEPEKSLFCQDIQSFLLKARKSKMAAMNNPSGDMGEIYSCDYDDNFATSDHDQEMMNQLHEVHVDSKTFTVNCKTEQEHAKKLAVQLLANRPYTEAELKKKLVSRDIAPQLVNYAIKAVQNCGLQSDLAYSETFARARWNSGTWGPQRIKLGLRQKGVKDDIIDAVLNSVFCDEEANNDCPDYGTMEISKPAMEQLIRQATKQWNRGNNVTMATKIRRLIHWLQYRGFSRNVIRTVLNSLESETAHEIES